MSDLAYDAILWDNDGVLVDTERLYYEATREIMRSVGVELDLPTYDEHFLRRGVGAWHLVRERGYSEADVAALQAARDLRHTELLDRPDLLIDGAREVLATLHGRLPMAIVTSAKRAHFEMAHRHSDIVAYLEFVLTREDYVNSKPDPEPYLAGLARIGVEPARCLVIEDTARGLASAKAAGLDCWVIPTALNRTSDFRQADAVLRDILEVPARLRVAPGRERARHVERG